jgi:hypothetical protein
VIDSAGHYIRRARELGPVGTVRRAWKRVTDELFLRGRELWWRWMARREMTDAALLAHTIGGWHSVAALLDHLAERPRSSFLLPHASQEEIVPLLQRCYPECVSSVLAAADAVCSGELSILGRASCFNGNIDWHREPVTGWRWPLQHRERLAKWVWSDGRPVDLRLTWELNRHQHFATLGIAYWLTSDLRYVEAFNSQVSSWLASNPVQLGVNWLDALEVGVRLIAWTLAFQFFRDSTVFRKEIGKEFLKSVFQQADFVSKHLQTTRSSVPNNHLMAEATALAVVGCAFPEFRAAKAWRETGLRLLKEQAVAQTHPDGANKEQAIGYHRFVAELLLLVVMLGRRGVLPKVPILEDTLERMSDYISYSLTPVGSVPLWGDSDYGRGLGIRQDEDFWDFRHLLAAGAVLFDQDNWKLLAGCFPEEAFWQLGISGLAAWDRLEASPPHQASRAFPHAGIYTIRDSWAADTDVAFFRCGPFGLGGEGHCSHAHCDLLSPLLWIKGRELLVDSGTYVYYGSWRDYFRLTSAHNTLMVDGYEQAKPLPHFGWQDVPQAECLAWEGRRVVGVMQAAPGVRHRREVNHHQPGVWEITDRVEGEGVHALSWFFHFAPDLSLHPGGADEYVMVEEHGSPFVLAVPPTGVHLEIKSGWYSLRYGHKEPNPLLLATWRGEIPVGGLSFAWKFQHVGEARNARDEC